MINRTDNHTHSNYSPDSEAELTALLAAAVKQQLAACAITDHCECDLYRQDGYDKTTAAAHAAIEQAKRQPLPFVLLNGIELGQPLQNPDAVAEVLARPYDVVLGSLHRAKGRPDYYFIDYRGFSGQDMDNLLTEYYEELYQMAKWNGFDVLSHLTYPLRYIVGDFKLPVNEGAYREIVAETFRLLAANGKALEINVSGLRGSLGCTLPDLPWIKLFRDLGGEFISIGSDAHDAAQVGVGVEMGMQLAYEAGFRHTVYFQNRKPHLVPLV